MGERCGGQREAQSPEWHPVKTACYTARGLAKTLAQPVRHSRSAPVPLDSLVYAVFRAAASLSLASFSVVGDYARTPYTRVFAVSPAGQPAEPCSRRRAPVGQIEFIAPLWWSTALPLRLRPSLDVSEVTVPGIHRGGGRTSGSARRLDPPSAGSARRRKTTAHHAPRGRTSTD